MNITEDHPVYGQVHTYSDGGAIEFETSSLDAPVKIGFAFELQCDHNHRTYTILAYNRILTGVLSFDYSELSEFSRNEFLRQEIEIYISDRYPNSEIRFLCA